MSEDFEALYNERTRMYDEMVEKAGSAQDAISKLEGKLAGLRTKLDIKTNNDRLMREANEEQAAKITQLQADLKKPWAEYAVRENLDLMERVTMLQEALLGLASWPHTMSQDRIDDLPPDVIKGLCDAHGARGLGMANPYRRRMQAIDEEERG